MKQLQIKNLVGFLRISILGRNPEFLLNYCKNEQIPIWDIIRVSKDKIVVSIYPFHFNKLADKAEANLYTVKIKKRIGLISFIHTLRARKEFIVAFILSAFVLYILSSVIWDVRIEGVTTEVESKL